MAPTGVLVAPVSFGAIWLKWLAKMWTCANKCCTEIPPVTSENPMCTIPTAPLPTVWEEELVTGKAERGAAEKIPGSAESALGPRELPGSFEQTRPANGSPPVLDAAPHDRDATGGASVGSSPSQRVAPSADAPSGSSGMPDFTTLRESMAQLIAEDAEASVEPRSVRHSRIPRWSTG